MNEVNKDQEASENVSELHSSNEIVSIKRIQRTVSISENLQIHQVPNRMEIKSLVPDIYYNQNDFDYFMFEARAEIFSVMEAHRVSRKEAKKLLFQPNQRSLEIKPKYSVFSIRKQALLVVSIFTYFAITIAVKYSNSV
jgi:hypothetical protein